MTEPLQLEVEGPDGSLSGVRVFEAPFVLVGRHPACNLMLDHPEVSRRHVYLQVVAGRLFSVDLESRTGTDLGQDSELMGWLDPGQTIRVGPYRIRHLAEASDEGPKSPPTVTDWPLPTSREFHPQEGVAGVLQKVDGSGSWQISRELLLVGRSQLCKIRLAELEASTFHCSLVRASGKLWVVDLLSRRGTFVNGHRVSCSMLADGEELSVGPLRFNYFRKPIAYRPALLPAPIELGPTEVTLWQGAAGVRELVARPDLAETLLVSLLSEIGRMREMQQQMADQYQQSLLTVVQMFGTMHDDKMALIREELAQVQKLTAEQKALQAELASGSSSAAGKATATTKSSATTGEGRRQQLDPVGNSGVPGVGGATPQRPLRSNSSAVADEIHATLVQRLAAIHRERQGRWQRLLGMVTGKPNKEGMP